MKSLKVLAWCLIIVSSMDLPANDVQRAELPQEQPPVSIYEVNSMLALGIIDVVATSGLVVTFYIGNGGQLCAFGKSQAIPMLTGLGLVVSAAGARATMSKPWIIAASVFSTTQGLLNVLRSYFGIWYHFIGGAALPFMPERHVNFQVDGEEFAEFDIWQFLDYSHHAEVARNVFNFYEFDQLSRRRRIIAGSVLLALPLATALGGIAQSVLGLCGIYQTFPKGPQVRAGADYSLR